MALISVSRFAMARRMARHVLPILKVCRNSLHSKPGPCVISARTYFFHTQTFPRRAMAHVSKPKAHNYKRLIVLCDGKSRLRIYIYPSTCPPGQRLTLPSNPRNLARFQRRQSRTSHQCHTFRESPPCEAHIPGDRRNRQQH